MPLHFPPPQTLRLEFDLPGVCYTFLLGDEQQCDCCATKLSCEPYGCHVTSGVM